VFVVDPVVPMIADPADLQWRRPSETYRRRRTGNNIGRRERDLLEFGEEVLGIPV
jgi:hypothetical protein